MIIDSEFTIAQYDGKMDLPLGTGTPIGIVSQSSEDIQYKKFIDNIKLIYGSQKADGSIPVFFKNTNNSINASSTLTSLKSAQAYYFISNIEHPLTKAKTVFPYKVPALSGTICGTSDDALVNFDHSSVVYVPEDGCATSLPITATVSNTINGYGYTFQVSAVGNNGTPTVVPSSGSITCNGDKDGKIPLSVLFNDSNNAVLTISLKKDGLVVCTDAMVLICSEETYIQSVSSQSIILNGQSLELSAQAVTVSCPQEYTNTGKPDISLNLPAVTYLTLSDLENAIPLNAIIRNTKKDNYEYNYIFNVSSNDGTPTIIPSSGSVYANTYKCDVAGSYSSGDITAMLYMSGAKDVLVEVQLLDKGKMLDSDSASMIYKRSDAHTDSQTYAVCPVLDNSNNTITLTGTNNYSINIPTTVSKLSVGRQYSYSFTGVSANWPTNVYPISGAFYADSDTVVLNNILYFDSDTNCSDCLPFATGVAFSTNIADKKFAVVKLTVQPEDVPGCENGTEKYINVYCDNCLLQPTPTPSSTPKITPTVTPTVTPTPSAQASFATAVAITSQTTTDGESSGSINFKGNVGDMLEFNSIGTPNSPTVMRLLINSIQVSQVTFPYDTYVGKSFRFTRGSTGIKYIGAFASGDVNIG
jgi:hypothetical protein